MKRLTAATLHGIWAGVTMSWDETDRFDEASYRTNTERMCRAGVHGVYTSGSTGEFYALDFAEFRRMVDIQAEICGRFDLPLQIGCHADCTGKTLQLLEYAARKPQVGAAQVVLPYWMELTDREVLHFFHDLYRACPDLPLVHYNIPRAKRFLNAADYLRILEVAPNLMGVKYTFAASNFGALQDALRRTPQLSYFVAENVLASAMMLGARGCYSSLIATNPAFMLTLYEHAVAGRWPAAVDMQRLVARFHADLSAFLEGRAEGTSDPVIDKGLSVAAGCATGSQRTRAPYLGWSDQTVRDLRAWLKERYPQFAYSAASESPARGDAERDKP
jgi:dihydrodipicolinate synthase/N-acetylneuraminate lyase